MFIPIVYSLVLFNYNVPTFEIQIMLLPFFSPSHLAAILNFKRYKDNNMKMFQSYCIIYQIKACITRNKKVNETKCPRCFVCDIT